MAALPGNRPEALRGGRKGQHSIRINDQWRICLTRIAEIVAERRGITADTTIRLGLYFKTSPEFWVNLQTRYDLDVAKDEGLAQIERDVHPLEQGALIEEEDEARREALARSQEERCPQPYSCEGSGGGFDEDFRAQGAVDLHAPQHRRPGGPSGYGAKTRKLSLRSQC